MATAVDSSMVSCAASRRRNPRTRRIRDTCSAYRPLRTPSNVDVATAATPPPPAPRTPTRANWDPPVNNSADIATVCQTVSPAETETAEADGVGAGRDADGQGLARDRAHRRRVRRPRRRDRAAFDLGPRVHPRMVTQVRDPAPPGVRGTEHPLIGPPPTEITFGYVSLSSRVVGFPNPVNEKAARVVAGLVVVTALAALVTQSGWLLWLLAAGFLLRVLSGPRFSPFGPARRPRSSRRGRPPEAGPRTSEAVRAGSRSRVRTGRRDQRHPRREHPRVGPGGPAHRRRSARVGVRVLPRLLDLRPASARRDDPRVRVRGVLVGSR